MNYSGRLGPSPKDDAKMPPPIDGIQLFFTAEFLRGRHWLLAYRRAAYGAAQFSTAAIFFTLDLSIRAVS